MKQFIKFNGRIDRRNPPSEGNPSDPVERENWLCRDGILKKPLGTSRAIDTDMGSSPTWMARYATIEVGLTPQKTFCYTTDGKLWRIDELARTATEKRSDLNASAYPKSWLYKKGNQVYMYLVDGKYLWEHDGNNDDRFDNKNIEDAAGDPIYPIDVIEHRDRLCLISKDYLYISANLDPTNFSSSTDSIQIVVGSGKGENYALGKIEDSLFIFTTEGIFVLAGDTISAIASTFEVRLVEERRILAPRSAVKVEKAILFLADDYNVWSFDGQSSQKITHPEKLEDYVEVAHIFLQKAVATYYNNYYMLSFVETANTENNLELWYDAFEEKCDFVRGRRVSCYMNTDTTKERDYQLLGSSHIGTIYQTGVGYNFDQDAIVTRLRTRAITPAKGENVRFVEFMPEFHPTGARTIRFEYFLDGLLSNTGSDIGWNQNLEGQYKQLGLLYFENQKTFIDAVRPKINYARGTSIEFFIRDMTINEKADFLGMGIEFVQKAAKKGKKVSQ